jgi:hypothetical protein
LTPQIPWLRVFVEGVVIVGSILLAFGLQAWWEGRRERRDEQELVFAFTAEFDGVEAELDRAREVHQARRESTAELIRLIDQGTPLPGADSLWSLMRAAGRATTLDPPNGVLSSALGAGSLTLIQNDSLRVLLASWPRLVSDHAGTEGNAHAWINAQLRPWLVAHDAFPPLPGPSPAWRDRVEGIVRQRDHRGMLWFLHDISGRILTENERLLSETHEIQGLLVRSRR